MRSFRPGGGKFTPRRFVRGKRRWTALNEAVEIQTSAADAVIYVATLVGVSDYDFSGGATEPEGATLAAIRGNFELRIPKNLGGNLGFYWTIGVFAQDEGTTAGGPNDPSTFSGLIEVDVLKCGCFMSTPFLAVPGNEVERYVTVDLTVKSKRVLRDQAVKFLLSCPMTANGPSIFGVMQSRSLLLFK